MPLSQKFKKLLRSTKRQYGRKKGKRIGYAVAKKLGWRT